jgi:hypothetical protein
MNVADPGEAQATPAVAAGEKPEDASAPAMPNAARLLKRRLLQTRPAGMAMTRKAKP